MTRVAVVDLGTNSTRLLVADIHDGRVDEVTRRLQITRLGEGVDAGQRLLPAPIARVRECVASYRDKVQSLGAERTLAFATSAVRDADNGEAFLGDIARDYGFETELLSGDEEALLTIAGATAGVELAGPVLVVDIGGGSTEVVRGIPDRVDFHVSLDMGCVRLTERCLPSDAPTAGELADAAAAARSLLAERVPAGRHTGGTDPPRALGVAGTVTALAALDLGLTDYDPDRVHGHVLSGPAVDGLLEHLAALPLAERRRLPGLEPERAPVIVAGAVILREFLHHMGLPALEASERDILHGAALQMAGAPYTTSGGSSAVTSSASRRCSTLRERTPTSRPPSTTGTRSASLSSRKRKASSRSSSESSV